jgi:hypothetical protein
LLFSLLRLFSIVFHVIRAGGTPGESAQSRAAQGEMRRFGPTPHCYSLLLTMPAVRERRARHASGTGTPSATSGHAVPLRAGCCHISRPVRRVLCTMSNSPAFGIVSEDHFECESF